MRMLKTIAENKTYIVRKMKQYRETTVGKKKLRNSNTCAYTYKDHEINLPIFF